MDAFETLGLVCLFVLSLLVELLAHMYNFVFCGPEHFEMGMSASRAPP